MKKVVLSRRERKIVDWLSSSRCWLFQGNITQVTFVTDVFKLRSSFFEEKVEIQSLGTANNRPF